MNDLNETRFPSHTTVSLLRPFSRLAFKTARPPLVLILLRKPCSRFLGILFG
jgi:hypothetical protein